MSDTYNEQVKLLLSCLPIIAQNPNYALKGGTALNMFVTEQYFTSTFEMPILSTSELYAGKICAALDRQHPRDFFDIKFILKEGISSETKIAFLVYLVSNNRPIYELLEPNRIDHRITYNKEFKGMTFVDVSYSELEDIREQLVNTIRHALTREDKEFLLSFKRGNPNWSHIPIPNVAELPGIKWKLLNLTKMDSAKHKLFIEKLEQVLYG